MNHTEGVEMITKDQLTEKATVVRLRNAHPVWGDTVIVKDLMQRKGWDKPERIGVGPADRGIAFGVRLSDIDSIVR